MVSVIVGSLGITVSEAETDTRPYRVAIVPFNIHAERDMTFLRDGIADMLTSRLSWEKKVEVVERGKTENALKNKTGTLNEMEAQILGATLEADYVLFGSLTIFGDSVSMDAKLVDVSGKQPTMAFFNQAQGMGQVIPRINQFATDINVKVFNRAAPLAPAAIAAAPSTPAPAAGTVAGVPVAAAPAPVPDQRAHPEKMAEGGFTSETASGTANSPFAAGAAGAAAGAAAGTADAPIGSQFIQPTEQSISPKFWKSRNYKALLNGVAIADVTKDGRMETVVMEQSKVHIYQVYNGALKKIFTIDGGTNNFIALDVADMNGNGYAEIYISSMNSRNEKSNSTVYEYNGSEYVKLIDDSPYWYRLVNLPMRGEVLLGQIMEVEEDPWKREIIELAWINGRLEPQGNVLPRQKANVIGIGYGDIQGNGGEDTLVAYSKFDDLLLMSIGGTQMWKSKEKFGGSRMFYLLPMEEKHYQNRQYLPMRVLVIDLDGDGRSEVLTAQNEEIGGRNLGSFRKFNDGRLVGFTWNGAGLDLAWKTRPLSGQVSDIAVGDFDNDGRRELVTTIITKAGVIAGTNPSSAVVAFDLK